MNKVILTGNICKDIVLKESEKGNKVIANTIAVRRGYKNAKGEYDADFINFVCWNGQAEYLNDYAKKGDKIELVGRWQVRSYEDSQGLNKQINEVIVESLNILVSKSEEKEESVNKEKVDKKKDKDMVNQLTEVVDDDLPF